MDFICDTCGRWTKQGCACTPDQQTAKEPTYEHICAAIKQSQHYHLEMFAAAFFKEVGNKKATQYSLYQQTSADGTTIRWWFERNKK